MVSPPRFEFVLGGPWKQMQSAPDSKYLYLARAADAALLIVFVWILREHSLEGLYFPMLLPLVVALFLLIRTPSPKHWIYISLIHQALAIVSAAVAIIFLLAAFIPSAASIVETWPAIVFCSVIAGLQLPSIFAARRFLHGQQFRISNSKAAICRTTMVLYFAIFFILLK
ncbi:MAG: hypothetical protein WAN14_22330 [Candidatus Acidiferrales bacterium]